MIKTQLLKAANRLGYNITKIPKPDLSLYKPYKEGTFYNIGAGSFRHPYWCNIDFKSNWYSHEMDIELDLMTLPDWPIESESAEAAYTSHTVEHLTNEAVQKVFNEAYRILKPGGIFRVTTPNIDLALQAYARNDRSYFYWADNYSTPAEMKRIGINKPMNEASIKQLLIYHFASSVSELHVDGSKHRISDNEARRLFFKKDSLYYALDFCTSRCELSVQAKYPGNHINWWNDVKLYDMLRKAGFKKVYRSGYGQSAHPAMRDTNLFDSTHPKISIYMEAKK